MRPVLGLGYHCHGARALVVQPRLRPRVNVAGMPIEEWLFFVVVSFVSVFTWEATKYFMRRQ